MKRFVIEMRCRTTLFFESGPKADENLWVRCTMDGKSANGVLIQATVELPASKNPYLVGGSYDFDIPAE